MPPQTDPRQASYDRLHARQNAGSSPTYSVGGQTYDTKTGNLLSGSTSGVHAPRSTMASYSTVPNSPANVPSSSASTVLGANAQNAANSTNQTPPTPNLDPGFKSFLTGGGFSEDEVNNMNSSDRFSYYQLYQTQQQTKDAAKQAKEDQDKIYNADLAKENADYNSASLKLDTQRKKDIDAAKALGYSADPYAATSSANGEGGSYGGAIGRKYAELQAELDAQAMSAKAALASGNASAYATINANMSKTLESGLKDIATLNETIKSRKDTLDLNNQTRNQGIADKELQTITEKTGNSILALPNDTASFNSDQMSTLTGTPGYNSLIKAGLSPNDALGYMKNAATSNKQIISQQKEASAINSANLRNVLLQNKVLNQQIETNAAAGYTTHPLGGAFAGAYSNIQANGIPDKINPSTGLSTYGTIGSALASGDLIGAKKQLESMALVAAKKANPTGVTLYQSFSSVSGLMDVVKKDIAALPPKDQTGIVNSTVEQIQNYFGKNPKGYQAAKVINDISLLTAAHARFMGGARGLSPSELTYLKQVMPDYANVGSLNQASFDTFSDFSNVLGKDVIGDVIGTDNYDAIYGKTVSKNQPPPLTATVPVGSTSGYSPTTGHWYAKDANGKVTQIQ